MIRIGKSMALAACMLLACAGCRKQSGDGTAVNFTAIDWNTAGTISGTIHYSGTPPKRVEIDMAQDPACVFGDKNFTEQYVVNHGAMQNVFVYVKDGLGNRVYPVPSDPVVMDQKSCRYIPHVMGVMIGQPVQFTNNDSTMHNIHMMPQADGNQTVDISQPPNAGSDQRVFHSPEAMIPVRCNNHPWMQAFLNVVNNPFYAVSDAEGHFTIKGLPPGTYTIVADQEKLGEKTATVTVAAKQTAAQDFTYEGVAP
ncbi:carboxypeptidase regulatory-like domain-containing protein [Acidipila sp. 4G-K13]|uniref:Rhamnogalacturonan lyase domain-containing protein n=2 Tax=Paracidobacterium acidisoli TaxID=2303751 RepID=A0A372IQW3_9BACT|nr:carboxypeptidase regulatory-like domain-containing protein [Paracidobacterium acidisoli]